MCSVVQSLRIPFSLLAKVLDSIPISLLAWLAPTHTYLLLTVGAGRRCLCFYQYHAVRKCHVPKFISRLMHDG